MKPPRIPAIALAVALLALALGLAACGEKSRGREPAKRSRSASRSTSTPTPTTPGSTWRRSSATSRKPGSTSRSTPPPTRGAAQAGRRRPVGPGDLLRAGGGAGPRAGPRRGRGRGARQPAADLDDLAEANPGSKASPTCKGKTVATAGIPYQDAFLKTILARAKLDPLRRQGGQRRLRPAAGAGRRQRRRRCSAASATSRASTCASAAKTRSSPRSTSSACRPTTSWCWSPTASAGRGPGEDPPLHRRAGARHRRPRSKQPESGDQSAARSQPGPRPETDQSRGGSDAAAARRAHRGAALRLHGPGAVGELRRLDARQRPDRRRCREPANCSATPTCRARSPNRRAPLRRAGG